MHPAAKLPTFQKNQEINGVKNVRISSDSLYKTLDIICNNINYIDSNSSKSIRNTKWY